MQDVFNFMHNIMAVDSFELNRLAAIRTKISCNFVAAVFTSHCGLRFERLHGYQFFVGAVVREQLFMCALFYDASFLHHDNHIGFLDG